jgi:hypothetical protein
MLKKVVKKVLHPSIQNYIKRFLQRKNRVYDMENLWRIINQRLSDYEFVKKWKTGIDSSVPFGPGFHGDKFVVSLADYFLKQSNVFIETGSYVGITAFHVGKNYPSIDVFSCDIDAKVLKIARENCIRNRNIMLNTLASPEFLYKLFKDNCRLEDKTITCWLDAHWYDYWPLKEEIAFLTSRIKKGFIMIDDFKVPGRPEFGFDVYNSNECSFDYIKDALDIAKAYKLIYPAYSKDEVEPRIDLQPLRGVGVVVIGTKDIVLPDAIADKFTLIPI